MSAMMFMPNYCDDAQANSSTLNQSNIRKPVNVIKERFRKKVLRRKLCDEDKNHVI